MRLFRGHSSALGAWLWLGALSIAGPGDACGPQTLVVVNGSLSSPDRFLYLSPASSVTPVAWQSLAFDDSAWGVAVPWTLNVPTDGLGWPWSAQDISGTSNGDDALLLRQSFTVPSGVSLGNASLDLFVDDRSTTWLNGVTVQADAVSYISDGAVRSFTLNSLTYGANVLAIQVNSPVAPGMGASFRVTVNYDSACPGTPMPTAPSGDSYAYPAPADGSQVRVAFNMPFDGTAHLRAYTLTGRLLSEAQADLPNGSATMILNIAGFARGTFAYQLTLEGGGNKQVLPLQTFMVRR